MIESKCLRVVNFVLPALCLFSCFYCRVAAAEVPREKAKPVAATEKTKPAPKGLVGLWRFDEASWTGAEKEVKDSSGKGNHGSAKGGGKTDDGLSGRCGKFDGKDDYLEFANTPGLNPSRITIMGWFNASRGSLEGQKFILLKSHASHAKPHYQYGLGLMDGAGVSKSAFFTLAVDGKLYECTMRKSPYQYGTWHHLAGTFDGNTMKLYLDGRKIASKTATGKISAYDAPLLIGAYGNLGKNDKYCFKGKLDEIAVYNRALSAKEILMQYRAASGESVLSYPGTGKVFNKVYGRHRRSLRSMYSHEA
ncbi:MAG: LamG domain-containing protein [Phycisphaerae bacterium]|nr:LamG domain-containing protein [Phycisphaerae bacterium]